MFQSPSLYTTVLPVRMCNRRDAIPPINVESGVLVRYVLCVCLCWIYVQYYVINSVSVVLGSDFDI